MDAKGTRGKSNKLNGEEYQLHFGVLLVRL